MSPEKTHKLMGFYMEVLIHVLGVTYTLVHAFCFFKLFPIGLTIFYDCHQGSMHGSITVSKWSSKPDSHIPCGPSLVPRLSGKPGYEASIYGPE